MRYVGRDGSLHVQALHSKACRMAEKVPPTPTKNRIFHDKPTDATENCSRQRDATEDPADVLPTIQMNYTMVRHEHTG